MSSNLSGQFAQAFSNPWTFYSTMMPYLSPAYSNFGYPFGVNTATPPWMGIQPQQSPFGQAMQGQGMPTQTSNASAPTPFSAYMANAMANPIQMNQPGVSSGVAGLPVSTNLQTNPTQQAATVNPLSISTSLAGQSAPQAQGGGGSSNNNNTPVPLSQQQMLTAMGWLPSVANGTPGGAFSGQPGFMIDPNSGAAINTQTGQIFHQGSLSGAEAPPNLSPQGMAGWTGDQRYLPQSTKDAGGGGGNA